MKSLMQLCLDRIVESISSGQVVDLSNSTPKLRQLILNDYLQYDYRYSRCGEKAPSAFSNMGFLDNMPSLDMRKGVADDGNLLNGFIKAINEMASVVDNLTDLRLNLYLLDRSRFEDYVCSRCDSRDRLVQFVLEESELPFIVANYQQAVMIVRKCCMISSLTLRFVRINSLRCSWTDEMCKHHGLEKFGSPAGLFNKISLMPHIQRLQKLRVVRDDKLNDFNFQCSSLRHLNLTRALTLEECCVESYDWFKFIENCRETLEVVLLNNVSVEGEILPMPLPNLQHFRAVSSNVVCTDTFAKNVQLCPQLQHLSFSLNCSEPVDALLSLSKLSILVELFVDLNDNADTINLVSTIFGDRVESVRIKSFMDFATISKEAIRAFVSFCTNLKSIDISHVNDAVADEFVIIFTDKSRAEKLVDVKLRGTFPQLLIDSLFENCTNLDTVSIFDCPQTKYKSIDDMVANPRILFCETLDSDYDGENYDSFDDYDGSVDSEFYYGSD